MYSSMEFMKRVQFPPNDLEFCNNNGAMFYSNEQRKMLEGSNFVANQSPADDEHSPAPREVYPPVQHESGLGVLRSAPQPLPSSWEDVSIRGGEVDDMGQAMHGSPARPHPADAYQPRASPGHMPSPATAQGYFFPQPQERHFGSLQVKIENPADAFPYNQCGLSRDPATSMPGYDSRSRSSLQGESAMKERRREQNRRAARKCREKKKVQQEGLLQSFEGMREENGRLKDEVELLKKDMSKLAELLQKHELTCPCVHTLPRIPDSYLSTSN